MTTYPSLSLELYNRDFISCVIIPGTENVKYGCCATRKYEMGYLCNDLNLHTCKDAEKYDFYDAFHPTKKVNHLLANLTL